MNEREPAVEKIFGKKSSVFFTFFTGFIRIRGVLNWFVISFFGFLLGISSLDITSYIVPLIFFVFSTFFILAFTFAINNYYDIDTDKANPRRAHLNAMASGNLSKQTGLLLNLIFIVIPLVLSLFFTVAVFVFCAFLIFWMWAYSAPPLRLKGRAGLDILWHFIAFLALVLWGSYLAGSVSLINILVAVSFGLFGVFAQIDNHIHDYPFDKASGSKTFAVWLGINKASVALKLSFIIYIVFLIPLIVLFSFSSYLTILIVCGGIIVSVLMIKIKKSALAPSLFYVINFFGGSVYVSCLIYHISSIL
ncbi:1,4-dihydroxy-2-naphthoate octaprenyltransferase [uncultured archaeon]|nr:1,4-dihydroxy-2-naphthoate octaprenyltransferase [uncultured archaeon]